MLLSNKKIRATGVVTIKLAWYAWPMAPIIKMQFGGVVRGFLKQLEVMASAASPKSLIL